MTEKTKKFIEKYGIDLEESAVADDDYEEQYQLVLDDDGNVVDTILLDKREYELA